MVRELATGSSGRLKVYQSGPRLWQSTCLASRLRERKERGVFAASVRENPKSAVKFPGRGSVQRLKRPEGRAPVTMGAGPNPTYAAKPSRSGLEGDRVPEWLDAIELKLLCKFDAIRFN